MIKGNNKIIFIFLALSLVFGGFGGYAAGSLNSSSIGYCKDNNENPVSVKEAIDTLYSSVDVATITPVGSILPYIGVTAPVNYLICDGSTYNIADYKKLADFIKDNFGSYNFFGGDGTTTFAVPDLRGEFLRGAGTNSHTNQGNGSTVGSHQDATLIDWIVPHHESSGDYISFSRSRDEISEIDRNADVFNTYSSGHAWVGAGSSNANGNAYVSYTARPTNTSVNYIIKVK